MTPWLDALVFRWRQLQVTDYDVHMSLESIYRVLSHAHKTATEANSGTADEKSVLDVLGGLTALVESRLQLHKRSAPMPVPSTAVSPPTPRPIPGAATPTPPSAAPADPKRRTPNEANESYDLK
jgi:hypothetical protein